MVLTTPTTPTSPTGQHHKQRRLSAVISDAARRSRERRKGPQSWFMLKLTIVIAAAIIAYTAYVYIGRLCIPMIKRERSSLGSRTMGSEYHNPLHTLHVLPTTTTENKNSRVRSRVRRAGIDGDMGIHKGASSYNSVVASCAHLNLYLLPFSTKAVFTPPGYAIKVSLRLVSTLAPTICEHTTPTPPPVFSPPALRPVSRRVFAVLFLMELPCPVRFSPRHSRSAGSFIHSFFVT